MYQYSPKSYDSYSVSLPGIELSNIKAINPAINICVLSSTTIKSSTTADPKKKQVIISVTYSG